MGRSKNKRNKTIKQKDTIKDNSFALQTCQSSMRVNLSYVSNLSDSENSSLKETNIKNDICTLEESLIHNDNILEIFKKYHCKEIKKTQNTLPSDIKGKEQRLNKSYMKLKDAIINKTKVLFDNKNELAIKTLEVLSTECNLPINEIIGININKSPSIRVNIGKNDQIIMSGNGKKRNPVQVNSMLNCSRNTEYIFQKKINEEYMLYNHSIVNTPKKSRTKGHVKGKEFHDKISPTVTRLFYDDNDSNNKTSMYRVSNERYCTSPILSQGIRKYKDSHLSVKNKFIKISSTSLSSNIINENLYNQNTFKKNKVDIFNTINLVDNKSNSETINISNDLNQSCMEITTIASHIPIIQKSVQHLYKSVMADNISNVCNGIKNCNLLIEEQMPSTITKNKNLNKKDNTLELFEQIENDSDSHNLSLNLNTIFDKIKLADYINQKENKIPNHTENKINKNINKLLGENYAINQQLNVYSISSMQLCTSLDIIKNPIIPNTINDDLEESHKMICLKSNINIDQDKQNNYIIGSRQPSTSTIRSSMQVNTSLDSIRKSPIIKTKLNLNNILSMVQESYYLSNINQNKITICSSKDQSLDSDNDLENIPLIERISDIFKTISTSKKFIKNNNIRSSTIKGSTETINIDSNTLTKSIKNKNTNLISNDLSIIEGTPYPISRSVHYKTMIKKNIAVNTPDPQKLVETLSNNEDINKLKRIFCKQKIPLKKNQSICTRKKIASFNLSDITIQNSSDEYFNETDRRKKVIIDESLNEIQDNIKSDKIFNIELKNNKVTSKRKLYPLQENSQFISFTPTDIEELSQKKKSQHTERKKRKITQKTQQNKLIRKSGETINKTESLENEIMLQKIEKRKKKNRKIIRKKIIVKKVTNLTLLDNMIRNEEKASQRLSDRNSLKEFDFKNIRHGKKENFYKNQKISIVVTGLSKIERDLIRSVIKTLGSATLELNVTPRTTHVISSGIRTINMLKGIIRGCWLLSLEWALKSLKNEKWLDPGPFEMIHFAKTVKENRRDRQLFGKAYVPELFVTCGTIYIENGTSPPTSSLKELIQIAGGKITEDPNKAEIIIGLAGLREVWILDSITTGEVQSLEQYKRN